MNRKSIVLFSNFELPTSCANATRMWSFAKMLRELKYDVFVLGVCYTDCDQLEGTYDGFNYKMIKAPNTHGFSAVNRARIVEKEIEREFNSLAHINEIGTIILSNVYYDYSRFFIKYSSRNKIRLIVNSVEWYDRSNELFDGIKGFVRFFQNRIALKYLHVKMGNIIAISTLLADYYSNKKCRTIVIPTVLDMLDYVNLPVPENDKLVLSYAGSPAKKDLVVNILKAIFELGNEANKFEMHFYGATREDFIRLGISSEQINSFPCVFFHGRIPYSEVKERIALSDFTVLLRPNKRYANAGFPTKVGESMACGTPVITNLTSDLSKYVKDKKTGIVCDDDSIASFKTAIITALSLDVNQRQEMRRQTLKMAYDSFDYRCYLNELETLICDND